MKQYFYFLVLFVFTISANAQLDSRNNSTSIPAVKSENKASSNNVLAPSKPLENETFNGLSAPRINPTLSVPKKKFSMFGETFVNPGDLYKKRLEKKSEAIKVEEGLGAKGSTTDQYFGDFRTNSEYVQVVYRDFGLEDGDLIRVLINDEILEYRVMLTNRSKGFKLDLVEGFNKIDFLALNEGYSMPNTAEFHVIDDKGNTIAGNQWNLAKGVKATIIVVKE